MGGPWDPCEGPPWSGFLVSFDAMSTLDWTRNCASRMDSLVPLSVTSFSPLASGGPSSST